jgi:hypothetical protein
MRVDRTVRIAALVFLLPGGGAFAQAPLLDEVRTVAAVSAGVPVEREVVISATGNYDVQLTDLGAPSAALASVRLAVSRGNSLVGTPLTAPGTLTFTASAGTTYVLRVTGSPGTGIGSGLFRLQLRSSGSATVIDDFVGILALPAGQPANGQFVNELPLTVAASGNYEVVLNDLHWPQALPTLLLALVEEGGPLLAALDSNVANPAQQTVTLDAAKRYRLFAIAEPAPGGGGVYDIDVRATGGGTSDLRRTTPVGEVILVDSITLAAGGHVLSVADLDFPAVLAQRGALLVRAGQAVVQTSSVGDSTFTAAAGPHDIYVTGTPGAGVDGGSLAVQIAPLGAAPVLSVARAFARPGSGASAFSYLVPIASAGTYRVRLADYQFPSPFTTLRVAAAQGIALIGTPLSAAGTFDVTPATGRIHVLAFAQTATQGLFGVDVTPAALGPVAFETTEGVGGTFYAGRISVTNSASYKVTASDLAFPAAFANLSTAVTRGADRIGLVFGGGSFNFAATPGNYFVNVIAQPNATEKAGTYALSTTQLPPPPVVTLTANPTQVANQGGPVDLTWSSTNSTGCTASGGWAGAKAVSGTERAASIMAATTFTLTCTGDGGTTPQSVSVSVAPANGGGGGGGGGGAFEIPTLLVMLGFLALRTSRRFRFRTQ